MESKERERAEVMPAAAAAAAEEEIPTPAGFAESAELASLRGELEVHDEQSRAAAESADKIVEGELERLTREFFKNT